MKTKKNKTDLSNENEALIQSCVSVSALIAEYLGWKNRNEYYKVPNLYPVTDYDTGWTECLPLEMEFNTRWDWLMPVIEKISKEVFKDGGISYPITFGMINPDNGNYMFRFHRCSLFEAPNLINAAFEAVGEFLRNRE